MTEVVYLGAKQTNLATFCNFAQDSVNKLQINTCQYILRQKYVQRLIYPVMENRFNYRTSKHLLILYLLHRFTSPLAVRLLKVIHLSFDNSFFLDKKHIVFCKFHDHRFNC